MADARLALARALTPDPNYTYGNILPMAKHNQTGALSPAIPGIVRSGLQGVSDLVNMRAAPSAQPGVNTLTPDGLGALMGLPVVGAAPAGAVATGAVRRAALPMDEASRMARAAEQGFTTPVFHETNANNMAGIASRGFDLGAVGARAGEDVLPDGVFLKPTGRSIGLGGETEVQMPLLHRAESLARFPNREALQRRLEADNKYRELMDARRAVDLTYKPQFEALDNARGRRGVGTPEENATIDRQLDELLKKWEAASDAASTAARARATELLKSEGWGGVHILNDAGSFGRKTETTVVFNPANIRSRFAAFDPAKKDSTDLLASRSPGYPLAGQQPQDQRRMELARALSKVQK